MTLVAVLLGAATAGGLTLASQLAPGGRHVADDQDFRPVVLLVTTTPPMVVLPSSVVATRVPTTTRTTIIPLTTTTSAAATTTTTTTAPTPPTTTTPTPSQTAQVFSLVNQYRAQAGCAPMTEDSRLDSAAQSHSVDMADNDYFSHTTPSGVSFEQREMAAGYPSPGGENIAKGYGSVQQVMTAWMNSSGHRVNILNCQFTTIGIGLDTNGWYWTQDFGY